ncbi:MAG: efflux RND transporter periplasmic adaptor subunit [Gammaproteobacteria bacterium]
MYQDVINARKQLYAQWRKIYPRAFLVLMGLALLLGCQDSGSEALEQGAETPVANNQAAPVPVRVARVEQGESSEVLRFAGVARPRQRANLSFQVGGTIETRYAEIGEQVVAGDIVARLYNPQLGPAADAAEARLRQLQNDVEQAERDLVRFEKIFEEGLLAIQDLEQQRTLLRNTQSAVDNARAIVAQNQQLRRESELRAPFTGRIEQILLESGEFAQPGQPVMRMSAQVGIEVEVRVPPHLLLDLSLGDTVPVWHGLNSANYEGIITEIGEGSSGDSALYPLVVGLQHTKLRSGEALEVGLNYSRGSELTIPLNAVMRSAQGLTVFRVNAENDSGRTTPTVSRVPVNVSRIIGDQVILTAGSLGPNDSVVYTGITRLADGDRIEILQASVDQRSQP